MPVAALLQLIDHDYRVIRTANGKQGRVLLRCKVATLLHFGLDALPGLELAYERNGGKHVGKWRTSPRKVCWQSFRIAEPVHYPSCKRFKGWSFALSANHRLFDFQTLAQLIEASGAPWVGFQKASGARLFEKDCLLSAASPVNA